MSIRTICQEPVPEQTALRYSAALTKEDGTALGSGEAGLTLTLTLYDVATGTIVNGLNASNILNTGRGTLSAGGALVVTLIPADLVVLTGEGSGGDRVMLIQGVWASGARATRHEVLFRVVNLDKVP